MEKDVTFSYSYSAKQNSEVFEIRKKYLLCEESTYDELKRLDNTVQNSGMAEALSTGIGGMLAFGLGLCLTMQIIGNGVFFIAIGILLSITGIVAMLIAYPVYRKIFEKTKEKYKSRILELTSELTNKIM